jgi:hypothetical protein
MKATMHLQLISAVLVMGLIFCVRSLNAMPVLADGPSQAGIHVHIIPLSQVMSTPAPLRISTQPHQDPFIAQMDDDVVVVPQAAAIAPTSGDTSPQQTALPILHGVVIGTHSYALLKDGAEERVVSVGDSLGNAKIVAITIHGVDLSDGMHLHASTQGN